MKLDIGYKFIVGLAAVMLAPFLFSISSANAALNDWTDDFESYTVGQDIGGQGLWQDSFTDWDVVNDYAQKGTQSVKSDSNANSQFWKLT